MYHFERIERIARWSLKIIHLLHFLRKSIAEVERRNSLVSSPFTCRKSHDRPAQYCLRIMHKARARCIHTDNCSVNAYCNNVDATGYVNDGYWREYRPEKSNAFSASVKKRGFGKWFSFLTRVWIIFKCNLWYNNSNVKLMKNKKKKKYLCEKWKRKN